MSTSKSSILIVDDTRANLRLLSGILSEENYIVRPVTDGRLAIASAQAYPPDLILLDIMMPRMSGYEVCEKLKADKQTRDIPVIFISARNEILDKVKAFTLGGVDYITKPFQAEEVLIRVQTHLALRNLQKHLEQKNRTLSETLEQLKSIQNQLIVQEKMASIGRLTSGVAHEIKNPLNFINSFAALSVELAQELKELIDSQKSRLDTQTIGDIDRILNDLQLNADSIHEEGRRADSIIRSMLFHSFETRGQFQKTDLNSLLGEAVNLAYHSMHGKDAYFDISIESDYDPDIRPQSVIPQDLSRVFVNLINNAYYSTYEKKEAEDSYSPILSIKTRNMDEYIEIRIRDNGVGIPTHMQPKIFDPFFTTKPAGKGAGLGLSISYDIIVQGHQGTIEVDAAEGEYAEFIISIPKKKSEKG
ncbi:MAG: response regulator [Desulfobacterales bacterium]|nr:response regulator [Desulfobacterales bacterium]